MYDALLISRPREDGLGLGCRLSDWPQRIKLAHGHLMLCWETTGDGGEFYHSMCPTNSVADIMI